MAEFVEIIENQRWYALLGWSSSLKAEDPPSWSSSDGMQCRTKDEYDGYEWQVYKSEDYDEDGWLYSTNFGEDWGPMTRSSAVRTRIWMGRKPVEGEKKEEKGADEKKAEEKVADSKEDAKESANGATEKAEDKEEWKTLFSDDNKGAESQGKQTDEYASLFPQAEKKEDNVLFPSDPSAKANAEPKTGFFGKVSAAAFSLPSSVINLAGTSSKQAVMGTVQSIKEVSMYALEHAQAATAAAISSEPQLPATQRQAKTTLSGALDAKSGEDPYAVLSMLSKRFPDLSPVDRSLVTCCVDDIPAHLNPPEAGNSKHCKACGHEFGMTKFRYQCGYCAESFCRDDLPYSEVIRAYGQTAPTKICTNCHYVLTEKVDQQLIQWRSERVDDFLSEKLIPYFNTSTDTAVDKILRAAEGTLAAAKSAPIGATAKMAVVSADFLRKYGRAGLLGFILRNEFMQSFNTLKGLIGDLDDLGFQDAAIGTYYFMAMNRGDRGSNPDVEREAHKGCTPVSDELLSDILKYAPLALHGIYELNVLDIQRISRLQNFTLIYAHIQNQDVRHPSFALLGNKEKKTALVLIRGSKSVQDLLTDIQAHPEEMGVSSSGAPANETTGGFVDAFAHNGMLKAAMWIKDRIVGSLRKLHQQGYQIVFAGHSLGAGCAALLSVMLQKEFEELRCFAYAVPACVNLHVAESCVDFVHSVVLRDDFVPRAKASNIMKLVDELKEFKSHWRDTASEDIEAFKERAKSLWAPRKREWAREQADMRKGKINTAHAHSPSNAESKSAKEVDATNSPSGEESAKVSSWTLTRTNLIDQLDKSVVNAEESVPESALKAEEKVVEELVTTLIDDPKELYIPGQVSHVYFYRGIYEAVHVDRKCDALARIPVFQNMLSDHLGRNYLSALRIVRDSRRMNPQLPEWVPFGIKTRCMCCDSPFTWNSTSSSEAQQNRDQHNCRKCGWLVCEGCSEKWKSIPEFGINVPVRVCDRCTYEL
ncbi:hypothetical protein Poli38472_003044 [Pythium oligandrum]|uniref:sn-1-specific diacylglycerol lipase n=1 Tax=Pythium oligandrum TaxID=41045 RepID=A0A8K1FDP2_PYTOL|nr:hypothetical protein Poli38472_003044 [Pythium oligandrum]|eukprot:TMW57119.1 hypothetical protein Poli38472_003044 [Pythium oligandrum]